LSLEIQGMGVKPWLLILSLPGQRVMQSRYLQGEYIFMSEGTMSRKLESLKNCCHEIIGMFPRKR